MGEKVDLAPVLRSVAPMLRRVPLPLCLVFVGLLLAACSSPSDDPPRPPAPAATDAFPDSVLSPPDSTARRFRAAIQHAMATSPDTTAIGPLMQEIGLFFRGRPYLAGTLDQPETETLVVRLDGFDCVTFIETVLAMARSAKAGDSTYAGFARRLAEQRYRNGTLQGYCSRLHYFTEWLANNEEKGIVERLDDDLGGRRMTDTLNFMSTHRGSYDRFATNDSLYACVQAMEEGLQAQQQRRPVHYVPQDSIRAVYDQLQAGDIVAMATSIGGLDVSHSGLVYAHDDGSKGLLHASLSDGIVVSPDLQRYVQTIDNQIGIVVARPRFTR